jgi:hypothetical protein
MKEDLAEVFCYGGVLEHERYEDVSRIGIQPYALGLTWTTLCIPTESLTRPITEELLEAWYE